MTETIKQLILTHCNAALGNIKDDMITEEALELLAKFTGWEGKVATTDSDGNTIEGDNPVSAAQHYVFFLMNKVVLDHLKKAMKREAARQAEQSIEQQLAS